ncbi:hypothetical protein BSL82_05840 [Tardibacter chloracetimidivorans]|uniref:Uncharacterized protein n=1 Tax=Tardibacter chloracetimidivorans TaxID=1921510 RepID=A0A1L3ZTC4_9SPHN|nr:hypothetical protein [Tardibacter chloracetimidivorans]API58891.1 hypothetical protein BSL82_05840 [Tardibacter chloracetimidivorans]
MTDAEAHGLITVLAIIFGYIALLRVLANLVYPMRERLFDLGASLLSKPDLANKDRAFVEHALHTALSFRASIFLLLTAIVGTVDSIARAVGLNFLKFDEPDRKYADMKSSFALRYFASALAANPIVAAILIMIAPVCILIVSLWGPVRIQITTEKMVRLAVQRA